jgi:hypothetical protein
VSAKCRLVEWEPLREERSANQIASERVTGLSVTETERKRAWKHPPYEKGVRTGGIQMDLP